MPRSDDSTSANLLTTPLTTRVASTGSRDADRMADELAEQLKDDDAKGVILFAPVDCDLDRLAKRLARSTSVPLFGCTTAGSIGPAGWTSGAVSASLGGDITFEGFAIDLATEAADVDHCVARVRERVAEDPSRSTVCVVLHDGLSGREEAIDHALQTGLGPTPLVGGSAGDDLLFRETRVLLGDTFRRGRSAVLCLGTRAPARTLKLQHFEPGERPLVITDSAPGSRLVREIDGLPAVEAYCEMIGVPPAQLTLSHCAKHPFVVEIDGDAYVRSIARIEPDGSLALLCSIDTGVVCTIGRAVAPVEAAEKALGALRECMGTPQLLLGFDCILRAIEARDHDLAAGLEAVYRRNNVLGFHTYGETLHGMHINQTFTGLALGKIG